MLIDANTIWGTNGAIKNIIDGKEMSGVISINTATKELLRYKTDSNGKYIIENNDVLTETIKFEVATVRFDNVIIEVN